MQHYRTLVGILEPSRLDPYYYAPHFVAHAAKMRSVFASRFRMGDEFDVLDGTHDSVTTSPFENDEFCITFLRAQDIGPGLLKSWTGAFLRRTDHLAKCKRSRILHGDVLLNIMASTGEACFYEDSYPADANANRAVGILRAKTQRISPAYKRFLCALLFSKVGNLELARNLKGSIQQRLNLSDISDSTVPIIDDRTAKYIGDKLRQAERLRLFQRTTIDEVATAFKINDSANADATPHKSFHSAVGELSSERLDAPFYHPDHVNLTKALKRVNALPLSHYCRYQNERWKRKENECDYLEIGELDVGVGRISPNRLKTADAPSRAQRLVESWDVLVSTVRPNRKNVALVPATSDGIPMVASTGFSVLRFSSKTESAFFHAWLRSDVATQQLVQWNTGATYPAIDEDVPLRILVPHFDETLIERLGSKLIAALSAADLCDQLVASAKLLVEALIDGKLSEADLSHAQTRLESGDTEADRAILSRLHDGGIDATNTGQLFSDLDAYYETLRQLEEAEPVEEAV